MIRTALLSAIADLRQHPELLDYVFASLAQDKFSGVTASVDTTRDYGEKELDEAKKWFLKTDIPVMMVPRIDEARVPAITIKLIDSTETEVTLGDIHYQTEEDTGDVSWPSLAGPFAVAGYDPNTGTVVIPDAVLAQVIVVPGMYLIDAQGGQHQILATAPSTTLVGSNTFPLEFQFDFGIGEPQTDQSALSNTFLIAPGNFDFSQTLLKGAPPALVTQLESVVYRETYQIGVHVMSEPVYLTWLHSILVFILLHYKQDLLEARGFERSVANSTDFDRNDNFPEDQNVFSRYINITGFVRHYWPKRTDPKITSFNPQPIQVIDSGNLPGDVDPNTQVWIGDLDTVGPK